MLFSGVASDGWQQDEVGIVQSGSGKMSFGSTEGDRKDGAALSGHSRMSSVHAPWHRSPPHPGHLAHP